MHARPPIRALVPIAPLAITLLATGHRGSRSAAVAVEACLP